MHFSLGLIAAATAALLLAGCQTQHNPDGSVRVSAPSLGQMLGADQGGLPSGGATAKPGETVLAQNAAGWKAVYVDQRQPGKPPFRYCAMDYSPGGFGGVAFQISQDQGLRVILDTPKRSFDAKSPVFTGEIAFSDGTKASYRYQAVGEHVAWIPPGVIDGLATMRHMEASARMSFTDKRGAMLEVPTNGVGPIIKAFNMCTLRRL